MRKIDKPSISQFDVCDSINNFRFTERVIDKSSNYQNEYKRTLQLKNDEVDFSNLHKDYLNYMKSMYSNRFANNQYTNSYIYYKKIREAEHCCPYCGFLSRRVAQLDHYLPKSVFPVHSITVDNLVPICMECNNNKDTYFSTNEDNTLLHPYFDEVLIDLNSFLKCRIIEEDKIGFEFYIERLNNWDDVLYNRVVTHFIIFKIEDLYRTEFEADFANLILELKLHYKIQENLDAIFQILQIKKQALENSNNKPWILAGVKSLVINDWFLNTYLPMVVLE